MCSAHSARHKWNDKYTNANQGDALWMHKMSSRRLWNQRRGLTHDSRYKLRCWPRRKCMHTILFRCVATQVTRFSFKIIARSPPAVCLPPRPRVVIALLRSPEVVIYPWRIFFILLSSPSTNINARFRLLQNILYRCGLQIFIFYTRSRPFDKRIRVWSPLVRVIFLFLNAFF